MFDKQRNTCVETVFGEFMRYSLSDLLYFFHLKQSSRNYCSINYQLFREFFRVCNGFLSDFNNPCKSSNFHGVPERDRSLTLQSPTLNRQNRRNICKYVGHNTFTKNRANWFACFSDVFLLLKFAVSNIYSFSSLIVSAYLTRFYEALIVTYKWYHK